MLTGLIFLLCEPARFPDKGFASMEVIPNLRHQIDLPRGPESWGYGDYDQGPPANHFVDHGYESIPRYRDTSYYNSASPSQFSSEGRSFSRSPLSETDEDLEDRILEEGFSGKVGVPTWQEHGRRSQTPSPSAPPFSGFIMPNLRRNVNLIQPRLKVETVHQK
ncbi:uncharacterized protein LOC131889204 [Tigriopus californicus]|uniref:uncharacterized protein LOC131889204 n=1 Tax=Tigriopus californicus TaxID=6832 RepID=UPI0027D9F43D|nr:uncharacterized protein LOC131889204 [Tigriopus californicus]